MLASRSEPPSLRLLLWRDTPTGGGGKELTARGRKLVSSLSGGRLWDHEENKVRTVGKQTAFGKHFLLPELPSSGGK